MPESPMKVGEIALKLNCTPNTIRNWCRRYAPYLSPTANPPTGDERSFTTRDINVLTYIHAAMNDGMNHDEIASTLAAKTFTDSEGDIVVSLPEVMPQTPPTTAQDAPESTFALQAVVSSLQAHSEAAQRRIATLEHELDAYRKRDLWTHGVAFYAGVVTMGAIFLLVWWLVNGF